MKVINFQIEPDLVITLDEMVKADDSDRSKFLRNLIRREFQSRRVAEEPELIVAQESASA